ncbi:MAG: hypothetical protein RL651_979 [Pseudomonadota bacterium]|jgi:general secretion pathway protein G
MALNKKLWQRAVRHAEKGFTLIEIMIVIVIIGILATLVIPNVMSRPDEARVVSARADVSTMVQALKLYKLDNGRYPTTEQGLSALSTKPVAEPMPRNWKRYLDKLPQDPWGAPYQYNNPGTHNNEIDVYSFGADGKLGGEGNDQEIGNW